MDELMIVANVAIIFGVMYKLFELYAKRKERIMLIEKLPPELLDKEMRIPKGSTGELVTEMLGTVKMNLLLNFNSTEYYQPGDTLPGKTNAGLMGAAEEKLVPQIEQMLPKMDSILYSLNKILADPALSATLHNAEKLTANLDVTTRQLNMLMQKDLPQLTGKLNTIADNFIAISDNLKGIDYASTFNKIDSTSTVTCPGFA